MKSLNLRENEIALILEALAQSIGNQSKAADLLGITRHALRRRMVKLRISPNGPDASSMAFRLRWLLRDRQPRSSADIIAALPDFTAQRIRVCLHYLKLKGDLVHEGRMYRLA